MENIYYVSCIITGIGCIVESMGEGQEWWVDNRMTLGKGLAMTLMPIFNTILALLYLGLFGMFIWEMFYYKNWRR